MPSPQVIRTLDDIPVKECFICLDEEAQDINPSVRRANNENWVHPCQCRLLAHQKCLLAIIALARRRGSAPKCPHCNYTYKFKYNLPLLIPTFLFRSGEIVVTTAGSIFFGVTLLSLGTLTVGVIHASLTAYGTYAARAIFGDELFDLLLTDDPSNWSTMSFLLLPMVPLRLMTRSLSGVSGLFFLWPDMPSLAVRERFIADSSKIDRVVPSFTQKVRHFSFPKIGIVIMLTSMVYDRLLRKVTHWLLDIRLDDAGAAQRPPQTARPWLPRLTRLGLAILGRDGPIVDNEPAGNRNPEQAPQVALPAGQEEEHRLDVIEAATRVRDLSMLSGLLVPFIAKGIGHLLYLTSVHIRPLRRLLGIRPTQFLLDAPAPSIPKLVPDLVGSINNVWYWRWFTEQAVDNMDRVWIRNTIGLGIFVVGRDCLHLFHLWLAKRELAGRHLKNRDFAGIDPAQLDLRPR
ncbi:hypothetical protein L218DRAFT_1071587 [Marasmius fiardii PR-910]|nr:hypothetical protein L218DRAFT_1071587 [Marasmius fiardii PR-910]